MVCAGRRRAEGRYGTGARGAGRRITVFSSPRDARRGFLRCGSLTLACALGSGGVTHRKREGDGATPAGRHRLLHLLIRPDRGLPPRSAIGSRALKASDGWCDAPRHGAYNRPVHLPFAASHEAMWRDDGLYDLVGVLDWNFSARRSYAGSAIFLHVARDGLAPTAGCIALKPRDLRLLLQAAGPSPVFVVADKPRPLRRGNAPF